MPRTITRRIILQKACGQAGLPPKQKTLALPLTVSKWFQILFHSPSGVLFTFPSRYLFTIGQMGVFSLRRWSSRIHARFLVSDVTQVQPQECALFHLQDFHLLRSPFPVTLQAVRLESAFVTPWNPYRDPRVALQPPISNGCTLTHIGFRLFPVRSPLLRESRLISFPLGTEMLHFPRLASEAY